MADKDHSPWVTALQGAINSVLVSVPIVWLETEAIRGQVGRYLRRLPFLVSILAKTLIYLALIVTSVQFLRWVFGHFVKQTVAFDRVFLEILIFAGSMSLAANIVLSIGSLLGWATFWRLLAGRYHHPRREERIFLSVDLKNSTELAEQIGDSRFHALLNAFFEDVAAGAVETEAEIYKYIGDEVILTWRPEQGLPAARCLQCPIAIRRLIDADRQLYLRRFGVVPEFRAALHIGEVVAGEVGNIKREIGYFGDTLNTTARLAGASKDFGVDVLVSEALLQRLEVPANVRIEPLAPLPMRGKALPVPIAGYSFAV